MGVATMNRRERRGLSLAFSHPARAKTGQPAHFVAWKREGEIKRHLEKMRVAWLVAQLEIRGAEERAIAKTLNLIGDNSDIHNVWRLSRASRSELLNIPGVGPKGLEKLGEYLTKHQVTLAWDR